MRLQNSPLGIYMAGISAVDKMISEVCLLKICTALNFIVYYIFLWQDVQS